MCQSRNPKLYPVPVARSHLTVGFDLGLFCRCLLYVRRRLENFSVDDVRENDEKISRACIHVAHAFGMREHPTKCVRPLSFAETLLSTMGTKKNKNM